MLLGALLLEEKVPKADEVRKSKNPISKKIM